MIAEYDDWDASEMAHRVALGDVSADELFDEALERVARRNPALNAAVLIQEGAARRAIAAGLPEGPLKGVPFLLKDLGCEAVDFPSHNGSRLLANTVYPRDSAIFDRIRATGAVIFGRTTSPEGGIGPTTEAAVYGGPTRNPWSTEHTPGGSSGGSGAAVAAGIVPAAHGSDGGGSVRIPASCCGLFGLKATRARLPDGPYAGEGWAGMAIDGFLTRSVRDSAVLLNTCAGADPGAPYWAPPLMEGFCAAIARPPRRLKIALCETTLTGEPIHADCRDAVLGAAQLLESLGHSVEPARPAADTKAMMRAWTTIVACGTALSVRKAIIARGRPLGNGEVEDVTRSALDHAATLSGADYLDAVGRIHTYGREMAAFFTDWDVLLTATLAEPPAELGRFAHSGKDYVDYRMGPGMVFDYSPFCAAFNASGQPAASLPLAVTDDGLPIGIHLAARFGADEELVALAAEIETAQPWSARRPPML
ncbi:6-aminohexanoate-cyclic-dimer hydrolase [Defluviimonas aquaemixtae]|uniref:6-aminohexanoate-cyclic-dimer hydrolase n=1 Tax=Albidovulum aquaemixtae TaxID=1542388 RepID=A0A2R8B738_9RHOB|nr:amidase [Defluviimonas aquaemixtae]SPH18445.1 6-aminohexanoate-cyclic-dimer hydrolase [Defluviimonas aquaemixtae]